MANHGDYFITPTPAIEAGCNGSEILTWMSYVSEVNFPPRWDIALGLALKLGGLRVRSVNS